MRLIVVLVAVVGVGYLGWQHFRQSGAANGDDYVTSSSGMAAYAKWSLARDTKAALTPAPRDIACADTASFRERTGLSSTYYYTCDVTYADGSTAQQCWVAVEPMPAMHNSNVGEDLNDPTCSTAMAHDPGTRTS